METAFVGWAELILAASVIGAVLLRVTPSVPIPRAVTLNFSLIAASPWRSALTAALVPLVLRVALLPWLGVPVPTIHDEFSLLLQADTFLSGRLSNPPHPFWEHFESFHILQQPTYASMYFPLRSAPLLLGKVLGHPWIGVILVFSMLCAAVTWALRGLATPELALLGGLLVGLRYGLFSYWINSYWGGSITALGGALVLGAYLRVRTRPRWRDGVALGVGVVLLMATRPLEGFFFCLPFVVALVLWLAGQVRMRKYDAGLRIAAPSLTFFAAGVAFMLTFNAAVTGSARETPYEINRHQYALAPASFFAEPIVGERRGDASMRRFYAWEAGAYERGGSTTGLANATGRKLVNLYRFYVGAALAVPFLAGAFVMAKRYPVPAAAGALVTLAFLTTSWDLAHYASPAFVLFIAAIVLGLDCFAARPAGKRPPLGRNTSFLATALPIAAILPLAIPSVFVMMGRASFGAVEIERPCCSYGGGPGSARQALVSQLEQLPGRDLVFINTETGDDLHFTWIANSADIDAADIVWARDLGAERNRGLIDYMPDRRTWYGAEGGLLRGVPLAGARTP